MRKSIPSGGNGESLRRGGKTPSGAVLFRRGMVVMVMVIVKQTSTPFSPRFFARTESIVSNQGAMPCSSNAAAAAPSVAPLETKTRKKKEEHRCNAVVKSRKIRRRPSRDSQIQSPPLSVPGARLGLPLAWARGGGLRAAELADRSGEVAPAPCGLGGFVCLAGL